MIIEETGGFIKNTAARKFDRGGNSMNLLKRIFVELNYNDEARKYTTEADSNINDYGYRLYRSMEYNIKYLKNDDSGLKGNVVNTFIR
ncbi:MAG TPA: hypothetical protein VEG39_13980 [Clostridia bacterium]|nr:hypothetical protein [Clostridia bacterium]